MAEQQGWRFIILEGTVSPAGRKDLFLLGWMIKKVDVLSRAAGTVPFPCGICWVPASYFPHECVAQQHMSHAGRQSKLSSSTCWTRCFTDLKSRNYLTPDWQSGIYKQEPQPELFNTGFLNSCTLRVSILLEMEPPEIWDAEQEATAPGFRKEVVGDLFFSQIWVFLLAAMPCCPWSQQGERSREQAMGTERNKGKMK